MNTKIKALSEYFKDWEMDIDDKDKGSNPDNYVYRATLTEDSDIGEGGESRMIRTEKQCYFTVNDVNTAEDIIIYEWVLEREQDEEGEWTTFRADELDTKKIEFTIRDGKYKAIAN